MADEEAKPAGNGADQPAAAAAPIKMQLLGQFIKDMSFENVLAQKGLTVDSAPEISVQVSLDAKKRAADNQYDVTSKYVVTAKKTGTDETMFLLELQYTGVFLIENVPQEQLHAFLLIECPRQVSPFARRFVHDVIREGGFPPLNLDNIDWVALYRQNVMRLAEASKAAQAPAS